MHRLTPEREKEIRDQLITARDINLSDYASFFCSMDIKSLLWEIDALRVENARLAQVPVKWNEDCYQQGYEAALQERDAALVRVKKLGKAKE